MSVTMPWTASDDTPVNGVANKIEDVRHALSKEAEHLAEMAAKYGREVGAHAADLADDAHKQASKIAPKAQVAARDTADQAQGWFGQLLKAFAALGTAFALSGRKTADDVSANAKSVAEDLGKWRLTNEPKKTGPDFMPGITLLAGFGAGIALMYFLDPEKGRERRNMVRDRLMSLTKSRPTADEFASEDTETWHASDYATSDDVLESTDYSSATGFGSTDVSATDTWGTQPQPTESSDIR